jgi:hypothetical protein
MAQPAERSGKLMYAVIGVGALVVVAITAGVLILVLRGGDDASSQQVAAAGQQPILAPGALAAPGAAGPGNPAAPAIAPAATITPLEGGGTAETPGEDETAGDASKRGTGGRRPGRGGEGAASEGPDPGPAASVGSQAPSATKTTTSTKGASDLDALLAGALGPTGAGPAPTAKTSTAPAPTGGGADSSLPQKLGRSQVQSGMRTVAGAVARCGRGETGRVTVDVVITGATGRVTSATVTGQFAGTAVGSCAARAVRGARFPRFRDASLTVRGYPFVLR